MTPAASGHLAMLLFSALVAGSFALGAAAANDISPLALNALRFVVAAAILLPLATLRGGLPWRGLVAPWRFLVLGGVFAVYFVLMFEGLKTAAPVSAAAVFTLTPIVTALIGWLLLRQVTTARMALALGLGAFGSLWVIFEADWAAVQRFDVGRGEAIYFVGCVAHAAYTPMVRWLNRGESALVSTFWTLMGGAIVLSVVAAPQIVATNWTDLPPRVWVAIFYTAVFASAATFTLLQFATLRLPASKVMAYTYLVPAWVALWAAGLGGAWPAPVIMVGLAITLLALVLLLKEEGQSAPSLPR